MDVMPRQGRARSSSPHLPVFANPEALQLSLFKSSTELTASPAHPAFWKAESSNLLITWSLDQSHQEAIQEPYPESPH